MKLLFIIVLLAIFSTSDAYGFLNKDKNKKVSKTTKSSISKTHVAVERQGEIQTNAKTKTNTKKSSLANKPVPSSIDTITASPKVEKSTVDKLHIIEKQHYHGNRELLIKHLQRQIELKKQQSLHQENTNNAATIKHQPVKESLPEYNHHKTNTVKSQVNSQDIQQQQQQQQQQQNNQVKRSLPTQRRTVQQRNLQSTQPSQVRQLQQIQQSLSQQAQLQNDMQHLPLQSNNINNVQQQQQRLQTQQTMQQQQQQQQLQTQQTMQQQQQQQQMQSQQTMQQQQQQQQLQTQQTMQQQQQQQQLQTQQTIQHLPQQQQPDVMIQQQHNQQLLHHQSMQQPQQGLFDHQHLSQQQNTMHHIQPQTQSSIRHEVNHIEQSFLPQQDLMHIQSQFKNRNNVQPQMQIQTHEPLNILQNGKQIYQSHASHAQTMAQQPQLHIQTLHQQPSHRLNNQLQLQQHNANQAAIQNQHVLMPINSISMDSLLSPQVMQPERFIIVKNNNVPAAAAKTQKPTTTTTPRPTTTTTTTTPKPTTTKSTIGEQERNIKRRPNLRQKFFEKEIHKQDLEITKLELEIRALKRMETDGIKSRELELEAARRKASATNSPSTTTPSMLPFLDFGKNKLKFPFDF